MSTNILSSMGGIRATYHDLGSSIWEIANGDAPAQRTEVEVNGLCSSGSIEPSLPVKTAVCPQMLLTDKTAEAIINSSTLVMV
jgi:hypothetical protein